MTDQRTSAGGGVSSHHAVRRPDFFILGAPKAGTTSLYTYLADHPGIFMPQIKEPFFFCSDFPGLRTRQTLITDEAKYLRLFCGARTDHLACGEASTFYLLSQEAVPRILEFQPAARFIVMLRNPVDLVYAHHSQMVRAMIEPVSEFEQAWRLQELRAERQLIPETCPEPVLLQYRPVGMLGAQMETLMSRVSRQRVKIVLLDDLAADPRGVYEEVLEFLGVPSDHRCEFPRLNAHGTHRSRLLARLVRNPPFPMSVLRDQYRRRVGVGTWAAKALARLNGKEIARSALPHTFRLELVAEFHDDVRLLEQVIDRDLSHWNAASVSRAN